MDAQTLRLMSRLRWGPFDATALGRVREELELQRDVLATAGDRDTLNEFVEHLQGWAKSTREASLASIALFEAGTVAETELGDSERAVDLYARSLEHDPTNMQGLDRAEPLLKELGRHEQLETLLAAQVQALGALGEEESPKLAQVFRVLAKLRSEQNRDVSEVIEALEGALDAAPDISDLSTLAELYEARAAPGDVQRAADLYATLGDVLGDPEGLPMIEKALDLLPTHEQALGTLEQLVPEAERPARLKDRWAAYLAQAAAGPNADGRRWSLVRAYQAEEQYQQALNCIVPLVKRGDRAAAELEVELRAKLAIQDRVATQASPDGTGAGKQEGEPRPPPLPAKPPSFKKTMLGHGVPVVAAVPVGAEIPEQDRGGRTDQTAPYESEHVPPLSEPGQPPAPSGGLRYEAEQPDAQMPEPPATPGFEQPEAPVGQEELWPDAAEPVFEEGVPPEVPAVDGVTDAGDAEAWPSAKPKPKGKWLVGGAVLALGAAGALAFAVFSRAPDDAARTGGAESKSAKQPGPGAAEKATAKARPQREKARDIAGGDRQAAAKRHERAGKAGKRAKGAKPGLAVRIWAKGTKYRGGKLDHSQFEKALQGAFPKIERCYGRALKRKPRLQGRLKFTWSVNKRGRSGRVRRVHGTIKDKPMMRCVAEAIGTVRFPKPKRRAAKVWVPFLFKQPK